MAVPQPDITVRTIADELGISDSRVRQLLMEMRLAGIEVGRLVGTVRLFSRADARKVSHFYGQKREYEKSSA